MHSSVLYQGVCSRWFEVHQSVRQGGVLSPWFYLLYINDMLKDLRHSTTALKIGDISVSFIAQADDVTLFSLTPVGLQVLIEIVYKYSCN